MTTIETSLLHLRVFAVRLLLPALLGAASLWLNPGAHAASQTWDNGANNFTWDTSSLNWGGAAWTAGNDAVFGATGVGTITVSGTQTVGTGSDTPLTFNAAGYTLSGGTLALPGLNYTSALAVNANATIASVLSSAGTTSTVIKSGTGTLTLDPGAGNTNTVGSFLVTNGTAQVASGTLNVTTAGSGASGASGTGLIISGSGSTLTIAGGTNNTSGYVSINSANKPEIIPNNPRF